MASWRFGKREDSLEYEDAKKYQRDLLNTLPSEYEKLDGTLKFSWLTEFVRIAAHT